MIGQCIAAGSDVTLPRMVLITLSIAMRIRPFPANSASDCLLFAKSRPQFCESCGATYRRTFEMFSALQSTSGPVTDVRNTVQIDALLATLSFLKLKLTKKRGSKFGALL